MATASLIENWIDQAERRVWFLYETSRKGMPAIEAGLESRQFRCAWNWLARFGLFIIAARRNVPLDPTATRSNFHAQSLSGRARRPGDAGAGFWRRADHAGLRQEGRRERFVRGRRRQDRQQKGEVEAVKAFGAHMVEAHSKTTEALKGIVQAEKLDVKIPTAVNKKQKKMLDALTAAKPEDFDQLYIKQQVKAHSKVVELFDAYAERGDNQALKQFAANTLPVMKEHLADAEKLKP